MELKQVSIREIVAEDAESFLRFINTLDSETSFMLFEPGERAATVESQRESIRYGIKTGNSKVYVAESGQDIVGFCLANKGQFNRNKHVASIILGVLQAASRIGIGTNLISKIVSWSKEAGVLRLELTVVAENESAIGLYRKMGFEIEGTRKNSMRIQGINHDEYYMAKPIGAF